MRRSIALVTMTTTLLMAGTASSFAAESDAALTKFCDVYFDVSVFFNNSPDDESSQKEIKAFEKKARVMLNKTQKAAPDDISGTLDTVVTAFKEDFQTAFEQPGVAEGVAELDQYTLENCDYEVIDVTAADYSFTGLPASVPSGQTVFNMTNQGTEPHEIVVFRITTDATLEDLLADEDLFDTDTQFIAAAFAEPGDSGSAYAELKKPGNYVAVCFVPVGTSGDTEGTGPPHFVEGMQAEFTVARA